jgi:hypothetical protein
MKREPKVTDGGREGCKGDYSGLEYGPMERCCEHGNEHSSSIN